MNHKLKISLEKLKNTGKETEIKLNEIRERIGAPIGDYGTVGKDFKGEKLKKLAQLNPDKPIIIDDEFCLAYIKDHTNTQFHGYKKDHDAEVKSHSSSRFMKGYKIHFYFCITLVNMSFKGLEARYRVTSHINNVQKIDLADAENLRTRLAFCQNCITLLGYSSRDKKETAAHGDAQELIDCVKGCYNYTDLF